MERSLGMFTTYGIEYVYDYLGKERINNKIDELKNKPTMGTRLEEFAYGNEAYFSRTGPLYIFMLLLNWFTDISFAVFLYESSRKYNELNYYDSGMLPARWKEHLSQIDWMNEQKKVTKAQYINYTVSKYWIDYHFLYLRLFAILKNLIKEKQLLELDITGQYKTEKNKLIGKINLEIKTRRKPLTGQYLLYRNAPDWYDLQKIESSELEDNYAFKKYNDTYSLVLDKKENVAVIKVVESDTTKEIYKQSILTFNPDEIIQKLISDYVPNIDEISARYKIEQDALSNSELVSNGCLYDIIEYYHSKGHIRKANEIVELNNKYSDVWRHIDEYDEN
jgi:hypothetical protein